MKSVITCLFIGLAVTMMSCNPQPELTPEEARKIAQEAYIYGFPMVMNYKTLYMYVVDENSPEYKGGFNHLACMARVYTPEDKAVVTPNSDTPYCMFWGDLRSEPLVLTIPDIGEDRFYQVQLVDLFTHNFAYVSTVSRGNVPGHYLITGPGWSEEIPEGIDDVIPCETWFCFAVVRTQLFNPEDIENVRSIQDAYRFEPLSAFSGSNPPPAIAETEFPEWNEGDQFSSKAFKYMNFMLSHVRVPPDEQELMERFSRLGLGMEKDLDINQFPAEIQEALEAGVQDGFAEMEAFIKENNADPLFSGKIFGTRDFLSKSARENFGLDHYYMLRMTAAHMGLYGNSAQEAIYPVYLKDNEGNPLDASGNKYTLTFAAGDLPPVSAFWSLTMYDGKTQLLIDNPVNRYLLNSPMMDGFVFGEDGSLTFYIQKDSPGQALEPNWLPAPDGPFYCVLRLYGPAESTLKGEWVNPPMTQVK